MKPKTSSLAARYRRYPRPAFTSTFDRGPSIARSLPSTVMIDAVLRLADRREPAGGCRVRLKCSATLTKWTRKPAVCWVRPTGG